MNDLYMIVAISLLAAIAVLMAWAAMDRCAAARMERRMDAELDEMDRQHEERTATQTAAVMIVEDALFRRDGWRKRENRGID